MSNKTYKKRSGTSGIQGQLYETKLMSLIYYRMKYDESVQQFNLATNRDDIGAFDDVCFKAKIKRFDKPLAVFIQAKHRENDKLLTLNTKSELTKYFESFLEIRRAFDVKGKDVIFGSAFEETECFFVMYTTAKGDPNNKAFKGKLADCLNKLIGTGGICTLPTYKDEDLDLLCKIVMKEEIKTLAEQLGKFISDESSNELSMNNNDLLLRYHVILALKVLDVSEIQPEGHRLASFRQDFFVNNDEFLVLIKGILCLEVLKKRNSGDGDKQSLLVKFLSDLSDVTTLSKLIGCVFTYKNDKLEFVIKSVTDDLKLKLDKANVPQLTVFAAAELDAKEYLLSRKLKVPAFFGNKDLAIRGNDKKIEKRLNHLTTKIIEILKESTPNHIVTIDESLGDGFLQLNGGLASAVGNILVFDETTKLLKFTNDNQSLDKIAKTWYETLKNKIENLHEYKLDVKVKLFPKLTFERRQFDEDLVREFYSKFLFYTNQAGQNGVEEILKDEIKGNPWNDVNYFRDRSELIYLKYHDEIQKMWMAPKVGSYLTKKSKIYENAVTYAMNESLMSVLKKMHTIKNQDYTLNENAIKKIGLNGQILGTIIVSESCVLTLAKVRQYLAKMDHVVLDLDYIFKLPLHSHNTFCKELTDSINETIFIAVCDQCRDFRHFENRLETIKAALVGKQIIVITNKDAVDIMTTYFSKVSVWNDEKSDISDLSDESRKKFLATYEIKFQGEDVSLDTIVDDKLVKLIEKDVFYKIINDETVEIGNAYILCNNYEKQFYIDRRVSHTKVHHTDETDNTIRNKVLKTFYDLDDDIVIITANRKMGKSTLLTHLALNTKEIDPKVWIVRIDLQEYKDAFTTFNLATDTLKSVEFLCKAALRDESIQFLGDDHNINLIMCSGDNSKKFQVKLFLHYYASGKLIVLINGFDEIDSEDQIKVAVWLTYVKKTTQQHKTWITSSSPSQLEGWLGLWSYKIENFRPCDQKTYLHTIWKHKIKFQNLYTDDIQSMEDFVDYMTSTMNKIEYFSAYVYFLDFLKVECVVAGIDFRYDEYFNNFMTRFGFTEDSLPSIPGDTTTDKLYKLALNFHINGEGMDYLFYEMSRGIYADF